MFLHCRFHDYVLSSICELIKKWAEVLRAGRCSRDDAGSSCSCGGRSGGECWVHGGGGTGRHNILLLGFFFFLAASAKGVTCLLKHIRIGGWEVSKKVGGFVLFVESMKCEPGVLQ